MPKLIKLPGRFIHSLTGTIGNIGNPLLSSLLVFYNMNEASGTRVDAVGSGHDLNTTIGTVTAGTGIISNAITLAASSAIGRTGGPGPITTAAIGSSTGFTITLWSFPTTLQDGKTIIGLHQDSDPLAQGSSTFSFLIQTVTAATKLRFIVSNITGNTVQHDTGTGLTENAWNFVACWFDPTLDLVYSQVNNGIINTAAYTSTCAVSATHNLVFGGNSILDPAPNTLVGRTDAVGIWGRVLTAPERTTLYNAGAGKEHPF